MTASTPGRGDRFDELRDGGQFVREDERVEGDEPADVAGVEEPHDLGQFVRREVGGPGAGVEVGQAEVDGVGPVGDRGAHGLPVAGGGEEFGANRLDAASRFQVVVLFGGEWGHFPILALPGPVGAGRHRVYGGGSRRVAPGKSELISARKAGLRIYVTRPDAEATVFQFCADWERTALMNPASPEPRPRSAA